MGLIDSDCRTLYKKLLTILKDILPQGRYHECNFLEVDGPVNPDEPNGGQVRVIEMIPLALPAKFVNYAIHIMTLLVSKIPNYPMKEISGGGEVPDYENPPISRLTHLLHAANDGIAEIGRAHV